MMDTVLRQGDAIQIDTNDLYYIKRSVEFEGEEYAVVYKVPDNVAEMIDDDKLEKLVVKVEIRGDDAYIAKVKDTEKIQRILQKGKNNK